METETLVKRAKCGDKSALVGLIMDKKSDYYRLAYIYMKNREDALDAMEDMIVAIYENIHRLKKNGSFYSWSRAILVNSCRQKLRDRKKLVSADVVEEQAAECKIAALEDRMLLDQYLSELDQKHQEVIKLKYFLDLEYKEIAGMLNIPVGTVKSRIFNGIGRLKAKFGGGECE